MGSENDPQASSDATAKKQVDPDFDLILDEHLAKNEWPVDKMAKIKSADRVSLMSQAMSEDLFNKLRDIKSPKVQKRVKLHPHFYLHVLTGMYINVVPLLAY
jgi:hypothetical protein